MGRNHGVLLNGLSTYFGPKSTSYFFTWAGGSQNWEILHGIYGGGALGRAKEIGETDAARFHLRSLDEDFARGSHRIVRYPDFLSFALFGIPGGGAFGLIAQHVLAKHGFYRGISELAPRTFIKSFDGTHNHRNPVAQIEFDQPESTFMEEIRANLNEFYRRVADYRAQHPEWAGKALPLEVSRELLRGLVNDDYVSLIPKATE